MPFNTIGPFRRGPFRPRNFIVPTAPALTAQAVDATTAVIPGLAILIMKNFSVAVPVGVAMQKQTAKTLAVAVTAAPAVQKQIPKTLAVASATTVAMKKQVNKAVAATSAVAVSLATIKTKLVALAVSVTAAAGLVTRTSKGVTIAATSAVTAAIATLKTLFKATSTGRQRRGEPRPYVLRVSLTAPTLVESKSPVRSEYRGVPVRAVLLGIALRTPGIPVPVFGPAAVETPFARRDGVLTGTRLTVPDEPAPRMSFAVEVPDSPGVDDDELLAALHAAGLL